MIYSHQTVPRETLDRLSHYVDLLLKWQRRINLISPDTQETIWQRHIDDSLQLFPLLPSRATHIGDIGSGAGLPAIPLALADPSRDWHLFESDQRKAVFLEEVVRSLDMPNVTIHCHRVEHVTASTLPTFPVVTARACAPLKKLCDWSIQFRGKQDDFTCIFPKGRQYSSELEEARRYWEFDCETQLSQTQEGAAILIVTRLQRRQS